MHPELGDAASLDPNYWACGERSRGRVGPPGAPPAVHSGPRGVLNGARGRSGGGEGSCPQGPARRGASPPWSQIEDLVFQVLMEPGVSGSSAPPTQWDRGNRQASPTGPVVILTTNDVFGLRRRAPGAPRRAKRARGSAPMHPGRVHVEMRGTPEPSGSGPDLLSSSARPRRTHKPRITVDIATSLPFVLYHHQQQLTVPPLQFGLQRWGVRLHLFLAGSRGVLSFCFGF